MCVTQHSPYRVLKENNKNIDILLNDVINTHSALISKYNKIFNIHNYNAS